jgi:two-component system alkaline phosphatase synthesis response regulator PhoP/two-component system response regulator VicR
VKPKKKILIVDDEPEVIKGLQIILEREGYRVITAYEGEACLKKAKDEKPCLIILDVNMPGMDGYQVCEKIKEDPATKNIPVMMLTAKSIDPTLERALMKKADWHIAKPYFSDYLVKKVRDLTQKRKKKNK